MLNLDEEGKTIREEVEDDRSSPSRVGSRPQATPYVVTICHVSRCGKTRVRNATLPSCAEKFHRRRRRPVESGAAANSAVGRNNCLRLPPFGFIAHWSRHPTSSSLSSALGGRFLGETSRRICQKCDPSWAGMWHRPDCRSVVAKADLGEVTPVGGGEFVVGQFRIRNDRILRPPG